MTEAMANARWPIDFVQDQFADGRRFRILNVIDDVTKESRRPWSTPRFQANAILAGIPAEEVKEQMLDLSARRKELDRLLATAP
ncbi:hypothetical protein EOW65_09180, partial [Sinirhodobacter ferrireducens]